MFFTDDDIRRIKDASTGHLFLIISYLIPARQIAGRVLQLLPEHLFQKDLFFLFLQDCWMDWESVQLS